MKRIAITGGIAEGKSTVMKMIADAGGSTLLADDVAKRIMSQPDVWEEVEEIVGHSSSGEPLTFAQLRLVISTDDQVRREINHLVHPLVLAELEDSPAQFFEVPILIEVGMHHYFDEVWVVTCGLIEQMRRLRDRQAGHDPFDLLRAQLDSKTRLAFADVVIRTDCSHSDTQSAINNELQRCFNQ